MEQEKIVFNREEVILNLQESESLRDCCRKFYQSNNPKRQATRLSRFCKKNNIDYETLIHRKKRKIEKTDSCLYCGKKFNGGDYRRRFCDHTCAALYNSNLRKSKFSGETVYFCKNCGKQIEKTYASKSNVYCDKKCESEFKKKETIQKWYSGELKMKNDWDIPQGVKTYLKERVGNKCERCGWHEVNPYTNKIPLQIHHIDGDCTNNSDDNLQILCPNCHSLTNNYGSLNKNACKERTKYIEKHRYNRRNNKELPE